MTRRALLGYVPFFPKILAAPVVFPVGNSVALNSLAHQIGPDFSEVMLEATAGAFSTVIFTITYDADSVVSTRIDAESFYK
jgi:hypothetical protein